MLSRFKPFALLVALVVASLAVGVSRPAAAGTSSLPDGFGAIAVDNVHRHVFVSSPTANAVTVLDFDGNVVQTIADLAGAGSMVVDGSTLYVVLGNLGAVDAYDTATYQRLGRYGQGTLVDPGPLAIAGGKLWTSTGQCGQWTTKLASIDLAAPHTVTVHDTPQTIEYCIGLADAPNNLNQLVAWDSGLEPASTLLLDVSSGAPVSVVEQRHESFGNLQQLAVTPDGTRVVAASGSPYEIDELRLSDQQPDGVVYSTGPYPNAVAVTGARGGLMAAGRYAPYDPDIDVFALGDPAKRVFSYDFGSGGGLLDARGLAFSGDGKLLFAVSAAGGSGATQLSVFDLTAAPPAPTSTTTTTRPAPTTTTTRPVGPSTTTTTAPAPMPVAPPPPPGPPPVAPGAAPATNSVTDPTGDVTDFSGAPVAEPRADLVGAGVTLQGGKVVFAMQGAQAQSPLTDPNWGNGSSYAAWDIDTNWDGKPDRLAILVSGGGALHGAITDMSQPPNVLCAATPAAAGTVLSLSVDPGCIGASSFSWGGFLMYDRGGAGAQGPYAIDFAPDDPLGGEFSTATAGAPATAAAAGGDGYWLLSSSGEVYPFGGAGRFGDQPTDAVDIEPTPTSGGYWILGRDGHVFAKGDAVALGDAPLAAGERAVSLSATPSGRGYWVFTDRGRVFNFGDAPREGDMAGVPLNGAVLGSVATPSGRGYWMVASDGGIFAFGDAVFSGSMGGHRLNKPVMSMAPDPDGHGYWLVASDGGIFAFDAPFYGSTGSLHLNQPISGLVPGRAGYLMVAQDGGIFTFGDVAFHGSLGATPPPQPIVAVALAGSR